MTAESPVLPDDILEQRQGAVLHIVLNRPERLNAVSAAHLRLLMRILLRAWRDESVGAILLSGEGRAFCAGHDLTGPDLGAVGATVWNRVFELLEEIPKPTVAAVNGLAVGGGLHLALACDLVLSADEATIGESFVWIGACPDTGGHIYLQRSIGHQRAAELLTMGRKVEARELADAGLFMASYPTAEELLEEAMRVATHLSRGPRLSYAVTRRGLEEARLQTVRETLAWEAKEEQRMTRTHDMREGVAAFLEKREPEFRGT
jgi:2-(1,2-epoxy-1,2-dihydrophenyl)acetyl-CoA isomerase